MEIKIGDSLTQEFNVAENKLAINVGSGDLRVLATPSVIAFMENTCAKLAQKYLDDEYTTVGTMVSVDHTSPTPFGATITVKATLVESNGRFFNFKVEAFDKKGIISNGTHSRVSVGKEKFQRKADDKFNEV